MQQLPSDLAALLARIDKLDPDTRAQVVELITSVLAFAGQPSEEATARPELAHECQR